MKKKEAEQEAVRRKYEADVKEIKRIEGIIEQQRRFGRERNFITAESKQKQVDRIKTSSKFRKVSLTRFTSNLRPRRFPATMC